MATATRIRRIPTSNEVSAPGSIRPTGANPGIDVDAQFAGGAALASGLGSMGAGLAALGQSIKNQERTADVAAADAAWLKGSLDLGNRFDGDNDFATFDKRANKESTTIRDEAAALIRDPQTRQAWLGQTELKRISLVDAVNDKGRELSRGADRERLSASIDDLYQIYTDPTVPEVTRKAAKSNMDAQIRVAEGSGLIDPASALKLKRLSGEKANETLAVNRARIDLITDPQRVLNGVAIPSTPGGGADVITAAIAANGGKLPQMDFSLAKVTADLIDDANFPDDAAQAKAYLSDPEMAGEYYQAAAAMLNERYDGDLTAVAVALDPEGGTVLADEWVKSKHNEDALPEGVRARLRQTMESYAPQRGGDRISITASPHVDLDNTDPQVLSRFEELQNAFGDVLPVISAHRDSEHNKAVGGADKSQHIDGRALDIDVSGLDEARRAELIQMASAMGFTGIGVYKNSMHFDTGPRRAWGPTHKEGSVPTWAKGYIAEHLAGTAEMPITSGAIDPRYKAMTFDQRMQLAAEARREVKAQNVSMQASLETIVSNAPHAIANTGVYDGDMPSATMFVQAYGAVEGIQRYRAFDMAVQSSEAMFGMRSMSNAQISEMVMQAAPKSSGNDAVLESKRFDIISSAAQQVLESRAKDPAGYVFQVLPEVGKAFKDAENDPEKRAEALTMMEKAQLEFGIDVPRLLPQQTVSAAVGKFKDATLPAQDRANALAVLVLQTDNRAQQIAIFNQLIDAGMPEYAQGAVAAMARNDISGAVNLMRAAMIDPAKLAGKLPGGVTDGMISDTIQTRIFDIDAIGDAIYGVENGSPENFGRMQADATLIERSVRLHLIDGSAASLEDAVSMTIKDMYGDVQLVTGQGVKITLKPEDNPQTFRAGFTELKPKMKDALMADMKNGMIMMFGEDTDLRSTGMKKIIETGIENAAQRVMDEGFFADAGNGKYQFFNPYTATVIADETGKPVLFTREDVLAAGAGRERGETPLPPTWGGENMGVLLPEIERE